MGRFQNSKKSGINQSGFTTLLKETAFRKTGWGLKGQLYVSPGGSDCDAAMAGADPAVQLQQPFPRPCGLPSGKDPNKINKKYLVGLHHGIRIGQKGRQSSSLRVGGRS